MLKDIISGDENPLEELERIKKLILQLYKQLRKEKKEKWDVDVPFEDLLFDRWERAKNLGFGEGSSVYHNSYIIHNVKVGKHTWIGPFVMLDGRGGITIGDYCNISSGVHIYSHDTVKRALTAGKAKEEKSPVTIGNCTYIGSKTIITKGVTIGDHCIIGACSLVNKDIPPYSKAYGIPAKVVGKIKINENGDIIFSKCEE